MSTPPVPSITTSCSFSDQKSFARSLATQTANSTNNIKTWRTRTFKKAEQSKVAPEFQELYPGKLLLQFHHGRKYDQDDLKAQDARAESDRGKVLEREGLEKVSGGVGGRSMWSGLVVGLCVLTFLHSAGITRPGVQWKGRTRIYGRWRWVYYNLPQASGTGRAGPQVKSREERSNELRIWYLHS